MDRSDWYGQTLGVQGMFSTGALCFCFGPLGLRRVWLKFPRSAQTTSHRAHHSLRVLRQGWDLSRTNLCTRRAVRHGLMYAWTLIRRCRMKARWSAWPRASSEMCQESNGIPYGSIGIHRQESLCRRGVRFWEGMSAGQGRNGLDGGGWLEVRPERFRLSLRRIWIGPRMGLRQGSLWQTTTTLWFFRWVRKLSGGRLFRDGKGEESGSVLRESAGEYY